MLGVYDCTRVLAHNIVVGGMQATPSLGPADMTRIKAAIASASTMDEIHRLEQALASKIMPSELANGNGVIPMDEG